MYLSSGSFGNVKPWLDSPRFRFVGELKSVADGSYRGKLMSGERVELLKFRSKRFLDVGVELLRREVLDLAAFNVQ